jgi:hypothetical protein
VRSFIPHSREQQHKQQQQQQQQLAWTNQLVIVVRIAISLLGTQARQNKSQHK